MCCTSCAQASQTTSKPVGMRAHCSLPLFPQPHLKTQVTTEVNLRLCSRLHRSSWCPHREANNCDARKILVCGSSHMRQLTALNQTKCTWASTKRHCSPAEAVLVEKCVAPPGFAEILKAHPQAWTQMILTKANTLCTVEGSRLLLQGHTRRIDTCVCFEYLTSQMSRVKEQTYNTHMPFYSDRSCELPNV